MLEIVLLALIGLFGIIVAEFFVFSYGVEVGRKQGRYETYNELFESIKGDLRKKIKRSD